MMIHSTNKATINLKITVIILLKKNKIYNLALILLSKKNSSEKSFQSMRERERKHRAQSLRFPILSEKKKRNKQLRIKIHFHARSRF